MYEWFKRRYLGAHLSPTQRSRNVLIVLTFFSWVVIFIGLIAFLVRNDNWGVGTSFFRVGSVFFLIFTPPALIRAHFQTQVQDSTMLYLWYVVVVGLMLSALVNYPAAQIPNAVIMIVMLNSLNLPHAHFHSLAFIPVFGVLLYNSIFPLYGYEYLFIATPQERDLLGTLVMWGRFVVWIPSVMILIRAQARGQEKAIQKLEKALGILKEVAEHISEYKTREADAVLTQYKDTKDSDAELLFVMQSIVNNLKRYKPFLPNYVLTDSSDDVAGTAGEDEENPSLPAPTSAAMLGRRSSAKLEKSHISSSSDSDDVQIANDSVVPFSPPSSTEDPLFAILEHTRSLKSGPPLQGIVTTERLITYVIAEYVVHNDDFIDNPQTLRKFVDRTYRLANATSGAVHCFFADTVHITWNTIKYVPLAKRCAVSFLRQATLQSNTRQILPSSRVEAFGSAVTGNAKCLLTGTQHLSFQIQYKWKHVQKCVHEVSRELQAVVLCQETASDVFESVIPVDVVDNNTRVFEMADSVTVAQYGARLKDTIEHCVKGDFVTSMGWLDQLPQSSLALLPCLLRLRTKLVFCQKYQMPFCQWYPNRVVSVLAQEDQT